jgi:diadenylate cyclase
VIDIIGNTAGNFINTITVVDIFDILVVAYLIYVVIRFIQDTRAWQVLKGIILLLVILQVSQLVGLNTVNYILSSLLQIGLLALVIVFQPELRKALEKAGASRFSFFQWFGTFPQQQRDVIQETIDSVCEACELLSQHKIGALIVFERKLDLEDVIKTGTVLNANIGSQLIVNIFFPNSPLHDGAIILREGKLYAAGCFLPLSQNQDISKELGTRHRAALGLAEAYDPLVVVVSEERGTISLAKDRSMLRNLSIDTLKAALEHNLIADEKKETRRSLFRKGSRTE